MRVCATGRDDDCSAWAGTICLIKRDGGPILVGLAQRTLRSLFPQRNCLGLCGEVAGLSKAHDGAQQQKINEKSHEEPPDETNIIRDSVRGHFAVAENEMQARRAVSFNSRKAQALRCIHLHHLPDCRCLQFRVELYRMRLSAALT